MVERFLRDVRVYQRGRVDLKLTVTDRGRGKSEQREAEEDKQKETEVVGDDRVEGLLRNSISFLFRYLRVQSNYPLTFRDIIEPRRLEFPFIGTNVARGELTLNSKSLGIVPLSLSLSLSLFLSLSLSLWTVDSNCFCPGCVKEFPRLVCSVESAPTGIQPPGKTRDSSVSLATTFPETRRSTCIAVCVPMSLGQFQQNRFVDAGLCILRCLIVSGNCLVIPRNVAVSDCKWEITVS